MGQEEPFVKANEECDTEEITVPCGYGNLHPVRMMVHTPKNLKGQKGQIPFFNIFSGGCIAGSVDINRNTACYFATTLGCVVFNPDYPLVGRSYGSTEEYGGRWATIDDATNSIIACIRYVHENCDKFGVDASKLVLEGLSGGGYITHAVCGKLALYGESNLIKLGISICALTLGWYISSTKEEIT